MILEPFQYFSPQSLDEAFEILSEHHGEAKIIAGGQSLIPLMKMGVEVSCIVDIKKILELKTIELSNDGSGKVSSVRVGALATYNEIERSGPVRKNIPLLAKTASGIGHPLVRNRGTIGGSLSHCDPAADLCATALALDAQICITGPGMKTRVQFAKDFFKGPLETDLHNDEILTSVIFPVSNMKIGYDVQKLTLGHGDFPVFIVSVSLHNDGIKFTDVAIALGGVGETAVRASECESLLRGRESITVEDIQEVSRMITERYDPPTSLELSPQYTREMLSVYTGKALRNAVHMVTG